MYNQKLELKPIIEHKKGALQEAIDYLFENINNFTQADLKNFILVFSGLNTKELYLLEKQDVLRLRNNYSFYELITHRKPSKIYIDLDNKKNEHEPLSYNDIVKFIEKFKEFLKYCYNIKGNINYSIHISIDKNEKINFDLNEKIIKSTHIILNCYVDDNKHLKMLFNKFFSAYSSLFENIYKQFDFSVYSRNKKFRFLYQAKEETPNIILRKVIVSEGKRTGVSSVIETNNINHNDFITLISEDDIFLDFDIHIENNIILSIANDENSEINTTFEYKINQKQKLHYLIKKKIEENNGYENSKKWFKYLNIIIQAVYLQGETKLTIEDYLNNDFIKLFLEYSKKVEKWRNSYDKNVNCIKNILEDIKKLNTILKKDNKKYCRMLVDYEVKKITEICGGKNYIVEDINIKQKKYYRLINKDTNQSHLYNFNICNLIPNYIIINDEIKKKGEEHLLILNSKFLNNQDKFKDVILVNDLEQVNKDNNQNVYCYAPCGSGKTFKVLLPNIKSILCDDEPNTIMIITDTISLSQKLYTDIINFLPNFKDNIVLYNNPKHKINENTKVLVVCYYSILKFKDFKASHILIDEYKNVSNCFTTLIGENSTREHSRLLLNEFCRRLQTSIIKLYDANLYDFDVKFLNRMTSENIEYYKLINFKQKNNTIILQNFNTALKDLLTCETRCLIGASSRINLMSIQEHIKHRKHLYIDKNGAYSSILLNHSDKHKRELRNEFINNPNHAKWLEYDFILYTPVITCGLSINNKVFDKTYFFTSSGGANVLQSCQMLERARDNISNTIVLVAFEDKLNTLKNSEIKTSNYINNENMIICQNNNNNEKKQKYITESLTDFDTDLEHNSNGNKIYEYCETYQEYLSKENNYTKQYNMLKVLFEWGHDNFVADLYERFNENEKEIFNNELENKLSIKDIEENTFLDTEYKNIDIKNNTYELSSEITKMFLLKRLGISIYNYNLLNNGDKKNLIDKWIIHNDFLKDNSKLTIFENLSYFKFFELKELLIYNLFETIVKDKTLNLIKSKENTNLNYVNKMFRKLFSMYIVFKFLDLIGYDTITKLSIFFKKCINEPCFIDGKIKQQKTFITEVSTKYDYIIEYLFKSIHYLKENHIKHKAHVLLYCFQNLGFIVNSSDKSERIVKPQIDVRINTNRYVINYDDDYIFETDNERVPSLKDGSAGVPHLEKDNHINELLFEYKNEYFKTDENIYIKLNENYYFIGKIYFDEIIDDYVVFRNKKNFVSRDVNLIAECKVSELQFQMTPVITLLNSNFLNDENDKYNKIYRELCNLCDNYVITDEIINNINETLKPTQINSSEVNEMRRKYETEFNKYFKYFGNGIDNGFDMDDKINELHNENIKLLHTNTLQDYRIIIENRKQELINKGQEQKLTEQEEKEKMKQFIKEQKLKEKEHKKTQTKEKSKMKAIEKVKCEFCDKLISKKNMAIHLKNKHS
jgi:hypothetical protein